MFLLAFAPLVAISGCGGSLFRVQPAIELPPLSGEVKSATGGGLVVKVAPLLEDEESQELFEANLPLSGVLSIRVEVQYESGTPIELRQARFRLRDSEGREWKLLSTKQAISLILKANGVFAYNPNSRKQLEADFGSYVLDLTEPLSPSDRRRQGFLFFAGPNRGPVEHQRGLRLQLERVPQPLEIEIN
jgi:hypothetical protein